MSRHACSTIVILAYFMGNDLRDNLERRGQAASPDQAADETWFEFFQRVNSDIRQHVRVYNLLYAAVRSQLGRDDLSEGELKEGGRITDDLLADLVAEVRSNDADLLLMVLPSWNQMRGYADAGEEEAQRRLLRKHAEQSEHVYLLDLTAEIERVAVDSFYGVNDKHFSVLGYYLTAKLAHEWINSEWPGGPQTARIVPAFHDRVAALEPDCATVAEYREAFSNPPDADSELASGRP